MLAVAEITYPCFQCGGVVFLDNAAVCFDASVTRDGCPFTGIVDESDVDRGV